MSGAINVEMKVNGARATVSIEPRTSLADCLRDQLHLNGTHIACEQGVCGACTILVDGRPVRSCITWAVSCQGADIRTIEGFDDDPTMAHLREAFTREHALQCGFCTPGMLITSRDIVQRLPGCDEIRVRHELSGNLCRCTGYAGIVRAVDSVVQSDGKRSSVTQATTQPPLPMFEPVDQASQAADPTVDGSLVQAQEPGAQITETIVVQSATPEQLWALLSDVQAAANCLPGARVDRVEGDIISGAVRVAFGPIRAEFVGDGTLRREDATRSAVIAGQASDTRSRTAAKATITYRVVSIPTQADASQLVIGMNYDVQGPLAQFSRSELVRSLVGQLVRDFGRNLEAYAGGRAPIAATRFNAFDLLWRWLVERLRGLFGIKRR